jgi:hypothetical protein
VAVSAKDALSIAFDEGHGQSNGRVDLRVNRSVVPHYLHTAGLNSEL